MPQHPVHAITAATHQGTYNTYQETWLLKIMRKGHDQDWRKVPSAVWLDTRGALLVARWLTRQNKQANMPANKLLHALAAGTSACCSAHLHSRSSAALSCPARSMATSRAGQAYRGRKQGLEHLDMSCLQAWRVDKPYVLSDLIGRRIAGCA